MKSVTLFSLVALLLMLGGCKDQVLYSDLSEKDANEMVSLLLKYDLHAEKITGKSKSYSVQTTTEHFAQAYELLSANGLPKNQFTTMHEVFDKNQLVSSKLAIRARYNYAIEQEMSHTLSIIDGVLSARVHLAVPETDPLAESVPLSSAAVLIKHREDVDLTPYIGQVKALVINGIENLPYENVTVALFPEMPMTMPKHIMTSDTADNPPIKLASMTGSGTGVLDLYRQFGALSYALIGFVLLAVVLVLMFRPRQRNKVSTVSTNDPMDRHG